MVKTRHNNKLQLRKAINSNCLPYEPVIGLSGRARLLPSRKYREIKLGGSLALPDKW
uniref:Uncharacterized protein n=1 Tax=Candidatus Kentrum sp. DK TaxID=2126562 RepID=A0A450T9I4_9GAMM|nr:MAG: hypothetical protein BECKDK2373C_GA0170839_110615 [Candidatus Kentron sp. DK]VFJ63593.1 MAG: hypothetical protein BECKDK2373B_GA0170837_112714 [Candidatus Kentron sp. DK]